MQDYAKYCVPLMRATLTRERIEPARELVLSHLIYAFNCKRPCLYVLLMGNEALKLVRAPDMCDSSSSFVSCMCDSFSCEKYVRRLS